MAVIVFILIRGLLVLVHELGHFIVAKRNGITAHEFGFGFPPRVFGVYFSKSNKWKTIFGSKDASDAKGTIYSFNLLPIGGFVKIKGEDGSGKDDKDSFANKSAWTRSKVLLAGVVMNFFLAWLLLSVGFMLGTSEDVGEKDVSGARIIVDMVASDSPAESMGLKMGDVLLSGSAGTKVDFYFVKDVQEFIRSEKGNEIILEVRRGEEILNLSGTPRIETVENQGALGIGLSRVAEIKRGFFESFYMGLRDMGNVFMLIGVTLWQLMFGRATGLDVTGIVGIAVYTGQIIPLGLVQILRFIAILSINLGIINALPFPALDGGRVLFILIEKIKGSPVSEKVEQAFHGAGFILLILLMVIVTFRDIIKFDIFGKVMGIF